MPAVLEAQVLGTELERVRTKIPDLYDFDTQFYGDIAKRDVEVVSNRAMRGPLAIHPGGNFGHFNPDGGSLGAGTGPQWDKFTMQPVHLKIGLEWTKLVEWVTDSNRKAVLNALRDMLAKAMKEYRRQTDSLCMQAGDGVIATVTSTTTAAGKDTITCTTDGFGVRLLRFSQFVSRYSSDLLTRRVFTGGNSVNGEGDVDLHDLANKQVRFSGASTVNANGDKIVVSGLTATPPVSLFGVPYHHSNASTGTWLGFDRSTTPEIRANRVNAGGSALALPFARLAMNKARDRVGIDTRKDCVAFMHPSQKQSYEELGQLVSIIQKSAKDEGLDLYFGDNMQLAGAPIKESFSWDRTRIDFIVKSTWGRAELHPADFYTVDGKKMFEKRNSSGEVLTSTQFFIASSWNLFVDNPAVCSYIDNLATVSGY